MLRTLSNLARSSIAVPLLRAVSRWDALRALHLKLRRIGHKVVLIGYLYVFFVLASAALYLLMDWR